METKRGGSVLVNGPGGPKWVGLAKARALVKGDGWEYVEAPPVDPVSQPDSTADPIAAAFAEFDAEEESDR